MKHAFPKIFPVLLCCIPGIFSTLQAQIFTPGWIGTSVIPDSVFLNSNSWTLNVADAGKSDHIAVDASGDTLQIHWVLGSGDRDKWVQCYIYFSTPRSFTGYDLFGFDLKGMNITGEVGFELKLEDGTHQAAVRWEKIAGLNRWANNLSVSKKQFDNSSPLNWNSIRVISLAVYAPRVTANLNMQNGVVKISPLRATTMANWPRVTERELIDPSGLSSVKENAVNALISRQKSTGLLTTWAEDGTSWLYGQGLALKALSLEGSWVGGVPSNAAAVAAEKLALFLVNHQQPEGYWPRAWNSSTGTVTVMREADGTIWMGDFPWPITGLQAYYKKSGDSRVKTSIAKGLDFLTPLIQDDGKFFTKNPQTGTTYEVASCEAYAAAILSLQESGDTARANDLLRYISSHGWDSGLRCWREATYSDRIVLFANTWMAYYNFQLGEIQKGLDALTLAGKVLYTKGSGEFYGMDGIVPLAVWYEGTLSYISVGGPGSSQLMEDIAARIHPDGMVSHYNENLGGMGGIWAVDWHSLDGTSWLYFTTAGVSPFEVMEGIPVGINTPEPIPSDEYFRINSDPDGKIHIQPLSLEQQELLVRLFSMDGKVLLERKYICGGEELVITPIMPLQSGIYLVQVIGKNWSGTKTIIE
ncbi:MAG: hypothetical protein U0T82_01655 [Bacteroidales bacterium]